jgi:hypothetical protein
MSTFVINSDESAQRFIGMVRQEYQAHRYLSVSLRTGKDRSQSQNALTHAWYEQIARELPDDDALGWKCYCKLHHGVPLLRAEDEEFRTVYDETIKGLSYEQKLKVMRVLPVTSLMTTGQLTKYAEAVRDDFSVRGVLLQAEQTA